MSVAELRLWAIQRTWGAKRTADPDLAIGRCVLLQPDLQTMQQWATIAASRAKSGRSGLVCGCLGRRNRAAL
jgi:hypothetical protein